MAECRINWTTFIPIRYIAWQAFRPCLPIIYIYDPGFLDQFEDISVFDEKDIEAVCSDGF